MNIIDFHAFAPIFEASDLRDYLELDNKLGIQEY